MQVTEITSVLSSVVMAADGDLWADALPFGNYPACLIQIVKSGTVNVASLAIKSGPTKETVLAVDHASAVIDASSSKTVYVPRLGSFLQGEISSWSGSGSLDISIMPVAYRSLSEQVLPAKYILGSVSKGANGTLWTNPIPIDPYPAAIVNIQKTGSISAGTLTLSTGADPLSLATVDDSNAVIDCHTASVQKYVSNLNKYLQATIGSWSGTGSISVTIELLGFRS
ncbi:MAG: hypothetical protein JXA73_00190 [Acidobacteria bacterium]|nr:hypothetical protein [Acidobacteriota bacterium]